MYTVKQVAEMMHISPESVRRYSNDFGAWLGQSARKQPDAAERFFTSHDVQVLLFIRQQLASGVRYKDIAQSLAVMREADLPEAPEAPPSTPAEELAALTMPERFVRTLEALADSKRELSRQADVLHDMMQQLALLRDEVRRLEAQQAKQPDSADTATEHAPTAANILERIFGRRTP